MGRTNGNVFTCYTLNRSCALSRYLDSVVEIWIILTRLFGTRDKKYIKIKKNSDVETNALTNILWEMFGNAETFFVQTEIPFIRINY